MVEAYLSAGETFRSVHLCQDSSSSIRVFGPINEGTSTGAKSNTKSQCRIAWSECAHIDVEDELFICLFFDIETGHDQSGFDLACQSIQQRRICDRPGNGDRNVLVKEFKVGFRRCGNLLR